MAKYNKIGINYSKTRIADPRIFDTIYELLEYPENKKIIDVGAGTGNYANLIAEKGNSITALEPSDEMIKQRVEKENVNWIKGTAENIKLDNNICDCAICILSIHHFSDLQESFNEIFRVLKPGGILLLYTYLPEDQEFFWLQDYFPELFKIDVEKFPNASKLKEIIKSCSFEVSVIKKFELHHDLKDNFLAANWRRPENYLKKKIQNGISTFRLLTSEEIKQGEDLLANDLKSGEWNKKYGEILEKKYFDAGYRFLKFTK